jgi:hypothetical protein
MKRSDFGGAKQANKDHFTIATKIGSGNYGESDILRLCQQVPLGAAPGLPDGIFSDQKS